MPVQSASGVPSHLLGPNVVHEQPGCAAHDVGLKSALQATAVPLQAGAGGAASTAGAMVPPPSAVAADAAPSTAAPPVGRTHRCEKQTNPGSHPPLAAQAHVSWPTLHAGSCPTPQPSASHTARITPARAHPLTASMLLMMLPLERLKTGATGFDAERQPPPRALRAKVSRLRQPTFAPTTEHGACRADVRCKTRNRGAGGARPAPAYCPARALDSSRPPIRAHPPRDPRLSAGTDPARDPAQEEHR